MASLGQLTTRYRWPLIIGIGGLSALAAYNSQRQRAAQVAAAAAAPVGADGAALDPNQVAGLIGQGANVAQQAFSIGAAPVGQALDLAGLATAGAQGLAATLAGSQAGVAGVLGDVAGTLAGTIGGMVTPSPLPVQPAPTPTPTPTPTPAPAPAPAPAPTFVGYQVLITAAGTIKGFVVGSNCSMTARTLTFSRSSNAMVARGTCSGRVYWRTLAGGYSGISYVAGLSSGPWAVRKVYRSASGVLSYVNIGQSGS